MILINPPPVIGVGDPNPRGRPQTRALGIIVARLITRAPVFQPMQEETKAGDLNTAPPAPPFNVAASQTDIEEGGGGQEEGGGGQR